MKRRLWTRIGCFLAAGALALAGAACNVAAAPPGEPVSVYLDGNEVLVLEPSDVKAPLDLLARLGVAPADVRYAELRAPDETPIRATDPAKRFPKRILAAFPAPGGVGVGWVDPVLGHLPSELQGPPPVSFAPASEVHLRTLDVDAAFGAVKRLPLHVIVGDQTFEYEMEDLSKLEHVGPMQALGVSNRRSAASGEALSSLVANALERAHASLDDVVEVVLRGPDGELRFKPDELGENTTRAASIKRNRKGLWRVKTWVRDGDRAVDGGGLRGVDEVEIVTR